MKLVNSDNNLSIASELQVYLISLVLTVQAIPYVNAE